MTMETVIALTFGFSVLAAAWALASFVRSYASPPRRKPLGAAERAVDPDRWIALPGNRIELGASGFYISLHTPRADERLPEPYLYRLWTPEGRLVAYGASLQAHKDMGERLAAEREEFVCRDFEPLPSSITKASR
jgi:hypothetical protein